MSFISKTWVDDQIVYAEDMNRIEQGIADAVSFTSQTLTDPQKTQARANIAAAPDGYGLGNPYGGSIPNNDFNQAVANGVYFVPFTTDLPTNGPPGMPTDGAVLLVLVGRIDCVKHQYLFLGTSGLQGQILHRYYHNILEVWSEWEYINPPMQLGVEYRTTERYLGKPVYKKLLPFTGAMTEGYSEMAHNIANIANVVECYAELFSGNTTLSTPILDGSAQIIFSAGTATVRKTAISIGGYSGYSARILMSYTKKTD